jgi:extracellular factor (EF) 3-hydroxypalmitic acid methyl ester biosynthesis protein
MATYAMRTLSDLGERIFRWELAAPGCESVRGRRDLLARYIDETVESTNGDAAILAVACGHLRELKLTKSWRQDRIRNFTALDQDAESLGIVRESFADHVVSAVSGSVRSIITGKHSYNNLDLVYAAGLYDYLQLPVAQRLTAVMFDMLRPGGRLLVANFHPSLTDIGAMETSMNWWLIYRKESEMEALTAEIDPSQIAGMKIFRDRGGNLVYLELTRKC